MSARCSVCRKKVDTMWRSGTQCTKCGYVYCGDCAHAHLMSDGKCPRCGGKCRAMYKD